MTIDLSLPWQVIEGDCLETMATLADEAVDAIVCDPPYELGFMGKRWDATGIAFRPSTWAAALRVAKPGAHLVAFGGTRTYHRMTCAIEDAGWEIRDGIGFAYDLADEIRARWAQLAPAEQAVAAAFLDTLPAGPLAWLYGSGFPKSHNGPWGGTALKPAWEPIILARKPLIGTVAKNVAAHGTGGLNVDGCRMGTHEIGVRREDSRREDRKNWRITGGSNGSGAASILGRWPANVVLDEVAAAMLDAQSGERGAAAQAGGPTRTSTSTSTSRGAYAGTETAAPFYGDTGGASRFFYCAKASRSDREAGLEGFPQKRADVGDDRPSGSFNERLGQRPDGTERRSVTAANHHPTVKPVDLMRWLCRLVTPPRGLVLDPFTGSGSTGLAATAEGFRFLGIERELDYVHIARARLQAATAQGSLFA